MRNNNKKKFVFIYPSIDDGYHGVNHGIAYLVPIIKKYGFDVSAIYLTEEITSEEFREKILRLNPTIVGFSAVSLQLKYLIKYSKAIADIPDILQIAGGTGPSLSPEIILTQSKIKGVAIGESEKSIPQLLERLNQKKDISHIEGFYWNIGGKIEKNSISQFVTDLSTLDFPDYSVFERSLIFSEPGGAISIQLSRGCPFNCTYCANPALRSIYPSSKGWVRMPSVEYSIKLIESLIRQYPEAKQKGISFDDELLASSKEWFMNFIQEYKQKINLPYGLCVRGENIDTEILNALKKSRCKMLYVGLESGNEQVRKNILKRYYSNEMFIKKCRMIKEAGIKLSTFNIIGFPHETVEQMKETLELNKTVKADSGVCTFFYPFPKTELYELCKKENLLPSQKEMLNITNHNQEPIIKLTSKQRKECIRIQKKIMKYLVPSSS